MQKNSVVVNEKMETNIEGIYAAGDVCTHEGKVKLIAVGFGEVPIAISHIKSIYRSKSESTATSTAQVFLKKLRAKGVFSALNKNTKRQNSTLLFDVSSLETCFLSKKCFVDIVF